MRTCPNCGEENPDRARFCLACGTGLSTFADEERKVVTVLACDLVGFTERSDLADPEDVKDTLRPFHARLLRDIEHFQGTVDQFIGDAVIGVFGAPVGHEDDPERAIRSALRILEAIEELNSGEPDRNLSVRIGIETGEAIVAVGGGRAGGRESRGGEPLVTGDVVARAVRLQAQAPPGGILVGAATYDAAATEFEWVAPVETGPADGRIPARARSLPGDDARRRQSTPLVGRVEELAVLKAAYRRAERESAPQLVTIAGEPGIGKSRMIAELAVFVDELPELVRWRKGRCLPYGDGVSFWALGEIVKREAGILESDDPGLAAKKARGAVDAVVPDETEAEWIAGRLQPLLGLGTTEESGDAEASFAAWRRFLEALAADAPLVMVIEDLHWADPAMLRFLDELVDWISGVPLLIVCAARPELFERNPGWGGGKRNSSIVSLPPLSDAETQMLLVSSLDEPPPAEAQRAILDRAGGNPLYAEEFARMLVDRGPGAEVPVPPTVQALIAARIDALTPETKAVLHDAAIVGREFWPSALAYLGGSSETDIEEHLREVLRKELARPRRTSRIRGQREYTFWHGIVRDVAESQIPRTERTQRHLGVAAWIEHAAGERVGDQADALAYHYGKALELVPEDEPSRPGLQSKTSQALTLAGDRAARLDAARAVKAYEDALALLPPDDPGRARLLVKVGEAAELVGNFELANASYQEAIDRFRDSGDRLALGEAMALLGRSIGIQARADEGMRLLQDAVEMLDKEEPGPELARATSRLAGQHLVAGHYEEGLAIAKRALQLARDLKMDGEEVRALQYRGALRMDNGDAGGLDDLRDALDLALERGLADETPIAWGNLAYQTWLRDGPPAALRLWRECAAFSEERGFSAHHRWSQAGQIECLYDLLEWDEGLAIAREMVAWDEAHGSSQIGLYGRTFELSVATLRMETERAQAGVDQMLPRARGSGIPEHVAMATLSAAALSVQRGDESSAMSYLEEFGQATEQAKDFRAEHLPNVMRLLLQLRMGERIDAWLVDDDAVSAPRHVLALDTTRALRALGSDDPAAAADSLERVRDRWRRMEVRSEVGLVSLGLGQALVRAGRAQEALAAIADGRSLLAPARAAWALRFADLFEEAARTGDIAGLRP